MLFNLLADDTATTTSSSSNWIMWVIIGVVLILMVVLTIIPQKKRQKEQQKMMDSLQVGTKLMTVGGMVGKISQVNSDNTLIINVGTENNPTYIVIDRKAVGYVLEAVQAPAPAPVVEEKKEEVVEEKAEETPVEEVKEEAVEETKEEEKAE